MILKRIYLLIAGMSIFILSCKKYEEDHGIFLHTPERRLCKTWNVEQLLVDGGDSTTKFGYGAGYSLTFERNLKIYYIETCSGCGTSASGKWSFEDHKNDLRIVDVYGGTNVLHILKLTNDEFRYFEYQGPHKYEFHMKAK